ncbi:hypothetical protein P4O66_018654 [Electrophorus voltai]|uniref:WH2 domain-containing protein n=1 Tax=Electrophorus voltai TaxID=2609070 RepID=A0AAD8YQ24_9TELE|nr:hypothetical protein P4O66_018654 [Electrophorus voltai]
MSSADSERLDSLEGWVAVKTNIFDESETYKIGFIVEWNVIESKFAVTCHNRTLQRQRRKQDPATRESETSWAGLFSVSDLQNVHRQFSGIADVLLSCFPDLSDFDEGNIWDLIFFSRSGSQSQEEEKDLESPCRQLEKYFSAAIDVCGRKIVLDTLFSQDEQDVEEYFENLQEFKRKSMEDEVIRAKERVRSILRSHRTAGGLMQLLKIYEEEDEVYKDLVAVATQYYQYLLQPFRDMRELAMLYKMEIQKSLQFEELGPKRVAALEREVEEWCRRGQEAVCSIQDITVCYFTDTATSLAVMLKQMEEDRKRFGAASWAVAMPRLEKLKFMLAKETLQHMRAKEMCLNRKKEGIREKMCDESRGVFEVDSLELQFYEAQLELYDCKLEILKNEELLLMAQIHTVQRQIKELKEEVVYYDTCEDPAELQGVQADSSPAHSRLRHRLLLLESKRAASSSNRATLRNKREKCVAAWELQQRVSQERAAQHVQHHAVHLKREKRKEEEEKRKEWVELERQKTLSRLRSFREKKSGQYLLKRPCSKPTAYGSCQNDSSQPMSIIMLAPPMDGVSQSSALNTKERGKVPMPRDVPVMLPLGAGAMSDHTFTPVPSAPPPPPPLPPPPCEAPPLPLSESEPATFPAKNTLKQCAGSMDEVLASLQRGQVRLRKVTPNAPGISTQTSSIRDNLLSAIRQGVTLKKVPPPPGPSPCCETDLQQSIKAAMLRMKRVSNESDDEEHSDIQSGDWDS